VRLSILIWARIGKPLASDGQIGADRLRNKPPVPAGQDGPAGAGCSVTAGVRKSLERCSGGLARHPPARPYRAARGRRSGCGRRPVRCVQDLRPPGRGARSGVRDAAAPTRPAPRPQGRPPVAREGRESGLGDRNRGGPVFPLPQGGAIHRALSKAPARRIVGHAGGLRHRRVEVQTDRA